MGWQCEFSHPPPRLCLPSAPVLNAPTAPKNPSPPTFSPRATYDPASPFLAQIILVHSTSWHPLVGQDKYPLAVWGRLLLASRVDSSSSTLFSITYVLPPTPFLACREQHGPPSKTSPGPTISPAPRLFCPKERQAVGFRVEWNTHCPTVYPSFLRRVS